MWRKNLSGPVVVFAGTHSGLKAGIDLIERLSFDGKTIASDSSAVSGFTASGISKWQRTDLSAGCLGLDKW